VPWLAGLCLISYLGDYPDPAAGNREFFGFGWGFLVLFLFTAVIYGLAMWSRLQRDRVEGHIADVEAEATAEKEELGASH
jgi:hypothetical protein